MIYKIIGVLIFAVFYLFYMAKLIIQKRQSIRTNQMGVGNKSKKVLNIERIMSVATFMTVVVTLCSVFVGKGIVATHFVSESCHTAGIVIGFLAVTFFASATITMKNNWRVGIPEEKTALVTEGIYRWSRNPAFVGFDLLYVSMCMLFLNIPLVVVSVWASIMLHLQILQEEEHMQKMFGEEYETYKKKTLRYFGRR
ncbi:MAG: isoprenylcysteine carboxylmethyltransferase family protein [Lachnospiraceae bacterium]|nr:isoprenylcysteine carboxylmethyltransferase family protein [Lachnospiraceae bacterium]